MEIVTVGSGVVDLTLHYAGESPFDPYDIKPTVGGDALNCAIDAAKLGVETGCVVRLGDDLFGGFIQKRMEQNGVDMSRVVLDRENPTGTVVVRVEPDGSRTVVGHQLGAESSFCLEDVDLDYIGTAKILHYGSAGLMPGLDGEGTKELFRACREQGVVTAMDLCFLDHDTDFSYVKNALPFTDIFLPSHYEAQEVSGGLTSCEELEEFFRPYGIKTMVVKRGPEGVFVTDFKERRYLPTFHVPQVVDVAGCGDSFCAGFLSAVSWGWSIWEAAVFGNAVGSMNCQAVGATLGVKSREETMAYIRANMGDVPEDLRGRFL